MTQLPPNGLFLEIKETISYPTEVWKSKPKKPKTPKMKKQKKKTTNLTKMLQKNLEKITHGMSHVGKEFYAAKHRIKLSYDHSDKWNLFINILFSQYPLD